MALLNATLNCTPMVILDVTHFVFLSLLSAHGRRCRFLPSESTDVIPKTLPSTCFALLGLLRTSNIIDVASIVSTSLEVVVA